MKKIIMSIVLALVFFFVSCGDQNKIETFYEDYLPEEHAHPKNDRMVTEAPVDLSHETYEDDEKILEKFQDEIAFDISEQMFRQIRYYNGLVYVWLYGSVGHDATGLLDSRGNVLITPQRDVTIRDAKNYAEIMESLGRPVIPDGFRLEPRAHFDLNPHGFQYNPNPYGLTIVRGLIGIPQICRVLLTVLANGFSNHNLSKFLHFATMGI